MLRRVASTYVGKSSGTGSDGASKRDRLPFGTPPPTGSSSHSLICRASFTAPSRHASGVQYLSMPITTAHSAMTCPSFLFRVVGEAPHQDASTCHSTYTVSKRKLSYTTEVDERTLGHQTLGTVLRCALESSHTYPSGFEGGVSTIVIEELHSLEAESQRYLPFIRNLRACLGFAGHCHVRTYYLLDYRNI